MGSLLASLEHFEDRLDEAVEHAAALAHGFHGTGGDLGGDHVTTYTKPDPHFPRAGTDPIDLGDPYTGNHPGTGGGGDAGLPSDGTGSGPLPNTGLPDDGSQPGLDPLGFGGGEGA